MRLLHVPREDPQTSADSGEEASGYRICRFIAVSACEFALSIVWSLIRFGVSGFGGVEFIGLGDHEVEQFV